MCSGQTRTRMISKLFPTQTVGAQSWILPCTCHKIALTLTREKANILAHTIDNFSPVLRQIQTIHGCKSLWLQSLSFAGSLFDLFVKFLRHSTQGEGNTSILQDQIFFLSTGIGIMAVCCMLAQGEGNTIHPERKYRLPRFLNRPCSNLLYAQEMSLAVPAVI